MCGRFTLSSPGEIVAELFELKEVPVLTPRYNIAPTQLVPAVVVGLGEEQPKTERPSPARARRRHPPERRLHMLHWGLVPYWAKEPGIGARMINARAETVAEKPAFRTAFRRRRCLVVADGFYEWQKLARGKQPHHIRMIDGRPFAFAGLWEHWAPRDDQVPEDDTAEAEAVDSCTILTTEPNDLLRPLHNRMPVILHPTDFEVWLDPAIDKPDLLEPLLVPYPPKEMTAYPVSTRVNRPTTDGPECVEPI
jgi:putative SOS response-associated peptidase YedK